MEKYETIISLEVHAELCTKTKLYCGCKNEYGSEVNTLVCPICSGMPGALPILNRTVVEHCIKMGLALDCKINLYSNQDRKSCFCPDLPNGYSISQSTLPLCEDGRLDIFVGEAIKTVGISGIYIEENTGEIECLGDNNRMLINYNRCGVPIINIVSRPELHSAEEAKEYLDTLHSILLCIGIIDAKMPQGSVRCDVKISLRPIDEGELGTVCEMRNIDGFGAVYREILNEVQRQTKLLDAGEKIVRQSRRWDDQKRESIVLHNKENVHNHRYLPDPDLLGLRIEQSLVDMIRESLPKLPVAKADSFMSDIK